MSEFKFDYDPEFDDLFIFDGEKIEDSVDIGNFIIDFGYDRNVHALEIMEVSKVLEKLGIRNSREILEHIESASFKIERMFGSIVVYYFVQSVKGNVSSSVALPIAVPAKI